MMNIPNMNISNLFNLNKPIQFGQAGEGSAAAVGSMNRQPQISGATAPTAEGNPFSGLSGSLMNPAKPSVTPGFGGYNQVGNKLDCCG